jgi:hypothetical protein
MLDSVDILSFIAVFEVDSLEVAGFYLLLAVPSIFLLWKQPVHNAGRRVLLVYTIVMLAMNTVFFVFMAIQTLSTISVEIQQSEPSKLTWLGLVVPIILRTPPILLNDILFVSTVLEALTKRCRQLSPHRSIERSSS